MESTKDLSKNKEQNQILMKEGEDILRKEYNNNLINNKLIIKIKHRISQEKWNKETKINS